MFELNNRKKNPFEFGVKESPLNECRDVSEENVLKSDDYLQYVRDVQCGELTGECQGDKKNDVAEKNGNLEKHVDVDEVVKGVAPESGEVEPSPLLLSQGVPSAQAPVLQRVSMVEGLGSVFGGGKATNDGNIQKLATIDKDLGLKTDIKDVVAMTCLDMIVVEAQRERLDVVARTYETISERLRVNLASHKGWRSRQLERIYSSRREEENENPELQDKLGGLGKRGSR